MNHTKEELEQMPTMGQMRPGTSWRCAMTASEHTLTDAKVSPYTNLRHLGESIPDYVLGYPGEKPRRDGYRHVAWYKPHPGDPAIPVFVARGADA